MSLVKTPVSILQELLQKTNITPQYDLLPSDGLGTHNPTFRFRVNAGEVIGFGKARSKKEAKHEAAKDALARFTDLGLYIPEQLATPPLQTSPVNQEPETPVFQINAVGMLKDFVAEHNLPPPEFTEISDVGPAHQRLFTLQCTVGTLKKTATEYTKKKAKQACAQLMYQCLLDYVPVVVDAEETDLKNHDEKPSINTVLQEFSNTSINFNKKKENYKLKVSEYPKTFINIMKEKNLSFADLWQVIQTHIENMKETCLYILQDVDTATEENLEKILNMLGLKFSLESFNNENNFIIFLSIDSEPNFSIGKIAASTQEAIPYLVTQAFEFLKIMTSG